MYKQSDFCKCQCGDFATTTVKRVVKDNFTNIKTVDIPVCDDYPECY